MYDVPEFYLVPNAIDRYSIGDRTPGLKVADDGSVTIYIGKDSPGQDKEPNWLPAPAGSFRPILRMYQPRNEILDGPRSSTAPTYSPRSTRSPRAEPLRAPVLGPPPTATGKARGSAWEYKPPVWSAGLSDAT
jgi:hypothetical protein